MEDSKKFNISWTVVILTLIFVWPIGLVLLFLKLTNNDGNNTKLKSSANKFWILAIVCYFLILAFFSILSDSTGSELITDLILLILAIVGAVIFTRKAIKLSKEYKYLKKYIEYIVAKRNISIEELAKSLGEPVEVVTKNVLKIINLKMIDGYINEFNEIVLNSYAQTNNMNNPREKVSTVKCKNCGATNKFIVGRENRCEYCDSILNKM